MIFDKTGSGWLLFLLLILSGCATKPEATQEDTAQHARSQVERGPIRVTAEVQPIRPRLSDSPTLTLTIDHEEGVKVEKPLFGTSIGKFTIRDVREPLPKTKNGRIVVQQDYSLEPTEAGRLRIDPIAVSYTDARPTGDNREYTIETEPLSIEVTSLLGDKTPTLGDLRGPAAPMALSSSSLAWFWAIAAFVLIAVLAIVWRRRYGLMKKTVAEKILTPEELAAMELDKLVASGLATSDIKQFYVELTAIVRRYIERTTGIRAPEQTTEEFLREISRLGSPSHRERVRARLAADHDNESSSPRALFSESERSLWDIRMRLQDFLEAADLVKFAAHRPNSNDVDESVRRARLFIGTKNAPLPEGEE